MYNKLTLLDDRFRMGGAMLSSEECTGRTDLALEEVACDLCKSWGHLQVLFRLGDWRYNKPSPEYSICKCRNCGLTQLNPRPTVQAMSTHYPHDYDNTRRTDSPITLARYQTQKDLLGDAPGRILDVGSAAGDFVQYLATYGLDVTGIDPYVRPGAAARVLPVDIFSETLDGERFDVITAWHVFEHVFSPTATLARMAALLRPGGRIVISVPNFSSYRGRWLRGEDVPRHLFFYDVKSLTKLAATAKLKVVKEVYDPRLAVGSLGRGAFVQYAYRLFANKNSFEFLRMCGGLEPYPNRDFPIAAFFAKWLARIERIVLAEDRLRKNGKLGVVAVVLTAK